MSTAKPASTPQIDSFRAQHLDIHNHAIATEDGPAAVLIDGGESPLGWLARRRGRDGRPLIAPHQLQAGERLRADFTRAHLMPRTTSNWESPIASGRRSGGGASAGHFTETMIASRQRMRQALENVGPEFSGLLLDVCCFLKRLEDIERERAWPARSAKIVLQLALDVLARHYGFSGEAHGAGRAELRAWLSDDAKAKVPNF